MGPRVLVLGDLLGARPIVGRVQDAWDLLAFVRLDVVRRDYERRQFLMD